MKIKKGTILKVYHDRSGTWIGIATKDFNTITDEWYSISLHQDKPVHGIVNTWEKGAEMPARRGLCRVKKI